MALDVYFKEDILNALRAAYAASEGSSSLAAQLNHDPEGSKLLAYYRLGFSDALRAVGLAFGLEFVLIGQFLNQEQPCLLPLNQEQPCLLPKKALNG